MTVDEATTIELLERHVVDVLLSPSAQAQYRAGDVSHSELRPFIAEIARLSRAYLSHSIGTSLTEPTDTELSAEAYALYYLTINAAKVMYLAPLLTSQTQRLRVLDFGCGPGTASLALLASLQRPLDITCVESSSSMRRVATKLLSSWSHNGARPDVAFAPAIPSKSQGQFDVVIAANSLAELSEAQAEELLRALAALVSPSGFLMLIEPGQQPHTRRLMRLRNQLAAELTPVFPCLRNDPCPMLESSQTDWCHGTLSWNQPKLSRQFDSLLGFNKHRIKFSAFMFQRGAPLKEGVRVIIPAEKQPRGVELTVCSAQFYGVVRIRKGDRSAQNRPLEKAAVFERLSVSEPLQAELSPNITATVLSR